MEYKKYPIKDIDGNEKLLTIASGPVIIQDGKVLLDKHGDDEFWKFPGGKLRDDNSMRDNAIREVKEELSVDVELTGDPYIMIVEKDNHIIHLVHYSAKIVGGEVSEGRDVREYGWFDVNDLPDDCAVNIKPAVEHFVNS